MSDELCFILIFLSTAIRRWTPLFKVKSVAKKGVSAKIFLSAIYLLASFPVHKISPKTNVCFKEDRKPTLQTEFSQSHNDCINEFGCHSFRAQDNCTSVFSEIKVSEFCCFKQTSWLHLDCLEKLMPIKTILTFTTQLG